MREASKGKPFFHKAMLSMHSYPLYALPLCLSPMSIEYTPRYGASHIPAELLPIRNMLPSRAL